VKNIVSTKADAEVDRTLNKLAGIEQDTQYGLYEFISNSRPKDPNAIMGIFHGVLLMDDRGVSKFESLRKSNTEPFWVYYNPTDRFLVVFPERKTAYQAPASFFQDPETHSALAAYDGIRLVLGLSDIWSNPERNNLERKSFGDRVEFQAPDRPYRWEVDLDSSSSTAPFASLQAKSGRRTLANISRKTTSMAIYDEAATQKYGGGVDTGGVHIDANLWQIEMAEAGRENQLQFTPYPKSSIDEAKLGQQLASVELEKDYKVEDLTVDRLKRWLDLR
jgi:hypothetical protein